MITLRNLNKYFNKGRSNEIHVINDISLELPERGMVAFFGPSGCGKTTLLNVIGGLDGYESGALEINGHDILSHTDDFRNQNIGYIFQNYNLNKNETVAENVADALKLCGMTDKETIEARVMAALENVGMAKYRHRLPDTLSGGQQQRVAIARAIVKNPPVILADEPTGNLDETNTVKVMELLKALSRDHLVLLVTHEANLVELYCDKVIGLSDGKVISVKDQDGAGVYAGRNRRDIWLGELPETSENLDFATIRYFGEKPDEPLSIRVVRYQGKTYVKVDTPDVRVLDESSETTLREGTFTESAASARSGEEVDLSALPPFEGTRFGRLFTFGSSAKSGFRSNFTVKKKGSRFFRLVLLLFAAVAVFIVARFGVVFRQLKDADSAYNHNVFYYSLKNGTSGAGFIDKAGADAAIDTSFVSETLYSNWYSELPAEETLSFVPGNFETFDAGWSATIAATGVYLPLRAADSYDLLAGRRDNPDNMDIILSRTTADQILENSNYGFLKDYTDLIGLMDSYNGYRIVGIVDSPETAFYLSDAGLGKASLDSGIDTDNDSPFEVEAGKFIFISLYYSETKAPQTLTLRGKQFTLQEYMTVNPWNTEEEYDAWLVRKNIVKMSLEDFCMTRVPEAKNDEKRLADACDELYYDYLDYYYEEFPTFMEIVNFCEPEFEYYWAAKGNTIAAAYCSDLNNETNRVYACLYKEQYGSYPSHTTVLTGNFEKVYGYPYESISQMRNDFSMLNEFENYRRMHTSYRYDSVVVLCEKDYNQLVYQSGKTEFLTSQSSDRQHLVIHSTDPEKTEQWLRSVLTEEEQKNLFTPSALRESIMDDYRADIITDSLTIIVLLAMMSLCMYFIMRSSLMSRVKEVGIYRAIGVSKGNILFRFAVESLTLTALTVVPGYLISSLIIGRWLGRSIIFGTMFYYPLWLALLLLVVLVAVSVLCGTLPVMTLLRKKPAEILSKYDI